jgi:glutamate-1-semialdehyde 2,1-aminomutase
METVPMTARDVYERARRVIPAGVHSNSRIVEPYPLYLAEAHGAHLWDVEGTEYLDFTMGNGSIILGHGDPSVEAAVEAAVRSGVTTGHETLASVSVIETMAQMIPAFGMARFANTGTEAVMHALQVARAITGRDGVAKPEGGYHGWYDPVYVSCWGSWETIGDSKAPAAPPGSPGLAASAATTLVVPFNDVDATAALLRANAARLAAVIIEPVMIDIGYVPASPEYLAMLRELTAKLGILLIFDELLTGFRLAQGGARESYGIRPDLTTYGKAIGNGYPIAVLEGRPELMEQTDPTHGRIAYIGTFNGHQIPVAAASATLEVLRSQPVLPVLNELFARLRDGLLRLADQRSIPLAVQGTGGHFHLNFTTGPVTNYRDALNSSAARYTTFRRVLAARKILVADKPLHHSHLSWAHTPEDVDRLLEAAEEAFSHEDFRVHG